MTLMAFAERHAPCVLPAPCSWLATGHCCSGCWLRGPVEPSQLLTAPACPARAAAERFSVCDPFLGGQTCPLRHGFQSQLCSCLFPALRQGFLGCDMGQEVLSQAIGSCSRNVFSGVGSLSPNHPQGQSLCPTGPLLGASYPRPPVAWSSLTGSETGTDFPVRGQHSEAPHGTPTPSLSVWLALPGGLGM